MVVIYHGSMEKIKDTTEAFIAWSEKEFLTLFNMKMNYDV